MLETLNPFYSKLRSRTGCSNRTAMDCSPEGKEEGDAKRKGSMSRLFDAAVCRDLGRGGGEKLIQLNLDGLVRIVEATQLTDNQRRVMELLNSLTVQICLGMLISLNMCLLVFETDTIAVGKSLPSWLVAANRLLLGVYFLELIARMYACSMLFLVSPFNLVDLTVVAVDLFMEIYTSSTQNVTPSITVFRVLRLARLARAYRIMYMLPMLSRMVRDLVGAFEAIVWGCLLLGLFTTGWSILGVQFIHPVVEEVVEETSLFDGCERCPRAFSSVWHANLTLFQAIVAGDSWGMLAIPLIEHAWWTSFFFVGTVFTLHLALMNVILALVVEKADDTRKSDLHEIMKIREAQLISKSKKMLKVCANLDEDGSGDLTLEELLLGFETSKEFAAQFHEMGIDKEDMKAVFTIMDSDNSGAVDYREFVQHIRKMKASDETTLLNLIRHQVGEVLSHTRKMVQKATTVETTQVRNNINLPVETVPSLFEERTPPPSHEFVREVTFHAKEFRSVPCHNALDCKQLQRSCNELLEQLSENLDRAFKDIAATSASNLDTLHSIQKIMATLVANRDAERRSISETEIPSREPPRPRNVETQLQLPNQRRNIAEAISSCCAMDHRAGSGTASSRAA